MMAARHGHRHTHLHMCTGKIMLRSFGLWLRQLPEDPLLIISFMAALVAGGGKGRDPLVEARCCRPCS